MHIITYYTFSLAKNNDGKKTLHTKIPTSLYCINTFLNQPLLQYYDDFALC